MSTLGGKSTETMIKSYYRYGQSTKEKLKYFFHFFSSFFPLLAHLGTLYKDVGGALCVDPVPVEVVGLEELGPELLLTKHKDGCQHEHLETVRQWDRDLE